jgi:hypothetical protein
MALRRPILGSIGRKERKACATTLASKLIAQLANSPNGQSCTVFVTEKSQLDAFRRTRPSGSTIDQQLIELRGRVRRQLESAGYTVALNIDSEVRNGKVYHLAVEATPVPRTVRVAARQNHPASR